MKFFAYVPGLSSGRHPSVTPIRTVLVGPEPVGVQHHKRHGLVYIYRAYEKRAYKPSRKYPYNSKKRGW